MISLYDYSQLQQLEETHAAEMTDLSALTEEFTRRMGESERKLQVALKVRQLCLLYEICF